MDDVKRLLEGFADRAADGLPDPDIEADVTRGRVALRRIKRRRRTTGVLCVAAASALVLVVGNQVKWWGSGGTNVASTTATPQVASEPSKPAAASATPRSKETISNFGAPVVELVANKQAWRTISCGLTPRGLTPETPIAANRVVLSQPEMRTADTATKVVLQTAPEAITLSKPRVSQVDGKSFRIGTLNGRLTGQVHVAGKWLLVELPTGTVEWSDDILQRFLASCTAK
ncbi:hypothetical protein GCM10009804_11710 [Kribbella hippodromi]|uniref:Uncharacterized protein n=1 Tax=Kribbella hippodromi TaxID=434347 RepID=A0ABN2CE97_9ACTN